MQIDWAEMEHLSSEISQKSFLVRAIIEMMIRKYYEDVKVLKVVKFYCHSAARWSVKVLSRGKQEAFLSACCIIITICLFLRISVLSKRVESFLRFKL